MSDEREIHGVRWKDDLAWMEEMRGERWNRLIKSEQNRWDQTLKKTGADKLVPVIKEELIAQTIIPSTPLFEAHGKIQISLTSLHSIRWKWIDSVEKQMKDGITLDVCTRFPSMAWVIEEDTASKGRELYCLSAYEKGKEQPVWKYRGSEGVAPYVCVMSEAGRIYLLEAKNRLIYWRLISLDAKTGKDRRIHYEEKDSRYNLELIRGNCQKAYMRRQSGPKQDLFYIESGEKGVVLSEHGISLESRRFIVSESSIWVWSKGQGWNKDYPGHSNGETLESVDVKKGIFITKKKGVRTIYGKKGKVIWRGIGQILMDPWGGPWVRITQPGLPVVWWNSHKKFPLAPCYPGIIHRINWILLKPLDTKTKPKGLLITGYGAYGLPTSLSTARWQPLLTRGWAIAIGLWRGGGDDTAEWEDSGRCTGREKVLKECAVAVREIQEAAGVSATNTWLYGRSAGGLWVGGLVAKYGAREDLFAGAYMEVPYLDVLRTTTNPALPLTDLEADEFGYPAVRLEDFVSVLKWSPMELLAARERKPKVKQIVRTGLNDSEVFAYESVKWVVRSGPSAVLAIEGGQGHFVGGQIGAEQQAEDLAVLLSLEN
jgi:hypothetical protein